MKKSKSNGGGQAPPRSQKSHNANVKQKATGEKKKEEGGGVWKNKTERKKAHRAKYCVVYVTKSRTHRDLPVSMIHSTIKVERREKGGGGGEGNEKSTKRRERKGSVVLK